MLFSYEDWETSIHAMRREHRRRKVVFGQDLRRDAVAVPCPARLDRFGLLEFEEATTAEARASRISVTRPDSELPVTGHAALAQIVAALPVGPAFAWLLRVPPFSLLADATLGWARGRATRLLGLGTVDPEVESDVRPRRLLRGVGRLRERASACAVMLLACLNQAIVELRGRRSAAKEWIAALNKKHGWKSSRRATWMRTLTHKARFSRAGSCSARTW
ncbi:MAG: hypothetical protein IPG04_05315 [Polyangiaceae bacterium]|nr:hypothetical protein [Polyangiaceae bacterium]